MKEQRRRKIHQFHPEIEDGTDLRRSKMNASVISYLFPKHEVSQGHHRLCPEKGRPTDGPLPRTIFQWFFRDPSLSDFSLVWFEVLP